MVVVVGGGVDAEMRVGVGWRDVLDGSRASRWLSCVVQEQQGSAVSLTCDNLVLGRLWGVCARRRGAAAGATYRWVGNGVRCCAIVHQGVEWATRYARSVSHLQDPRGVQGEVYAARRRFIWRAPGVFGWLLGGRGGGSSRGGAAGGGRRRAGSSTSRCCVGRTVCALGQSLAGPS